MTLSPAVELAYLGIMTVAEVYSVYTQYSHLYSRGAVSDPPKTSSRAPHHPSTWMLPSYANKLYCHVCNALHQYFAVEQHVLLSTPVNLPTMERGNSAVFVIPLADIQTSGLDAKRYQAEFDATIANLSAPAYIDVAVLVPPSPPKLRRSAVFASTQHFIAQTYSLFNRICEPHLRAAHDQHQPSPEICVYLATTGDAHGSNSIAGTGPIFQLAKLEASRERWSIIHIWASSGAEIPAAFQSAGTGDAAPQIDVHRRDPSPNVSAEPWAASLSVSPASAPSARAYQSVIIGGTFDNVHDGHRLLLAAMALVLDGTTAQPRRLIIGISGDKLLQKKQYASMLQSWEERQSAVFRFLSRVVSLDTAVVDLRPERRNDPGPNGKACIYTLPERLTIECVEIQDPYGPTITDETIDAIVVSVETRAGGQAVNKERGDKGWRLLDVFEVEVLCPEGGEGVEGKLSSTERRRLLYETANGGKTDSAS